MLHKLRAGEPPVSEYILVPDQLEEEGDTAGELGMDGENIVMLPVGEYQTIGNLNALNAFMRKYFLKPTILWNIFCRGTAVLSAFSLKWRRLKSANGWMQHLQH